jgi:hypothetical protein
VTALDRPAVTDPQRRTVADTVWRLCVAAILLFAVAFDAAGLLVGGDAVYQSQSYDVLRMLTPWGMRGYWPALAALGLVTLYAYGNHRTRRSWQLLRVCLSLLAGWYVLWAVGIAGAWALNGAILAWGNVGKLLLTATLCGICARTAPRE